jgi:hypothetical protein
MGKAPTKLRTLSGGFRLPLAITKPGTALLNRQMWAFGRDVLHPDGNLLVRYGFERLPAPNARWHSAYVLPINAQQSLMAWGFGLWWRDLSVGSIFLKRYDFRPQFTASSALPQVWAVENLPSLTAEPTDRPSALTLLAALLDALASYEAWVLAVCGGVYRARVLASCPEQHRALCAAEDGAAAWRDLAAQVADHGKLANTIAQPA